MLQVNNVSVRYGALTIVDSVQFAVEENQWLMIVGPNGAGKSTLINAIAQTTPYSGQILLHQKDIKTYKPAALARNMGILMQNNHVEYSFSVEEVVKLGRYAYSKGLFAAPDDEDEQKIEEALQATGMAKMRKQSVLTLSGGELQRTFLAQLLAQDPKLLILDEPANHLDLVYQKMVFGLVEEWRMRTGRAVISVVHDLSLAKAFGTHALLLDKGKQIALGKTGKVLLGSNLQQAYNMDVEAWMKEMLAQWV